MNKHDLIAAVAASTNLSKTDAAGAIDAMRKAGEGRNPQTGEKIKIAAANVPRFKASKQLKEAIN